MNKLELRICVLFLALMVSMSTKAQNDSIQISSNQPSKTDMLSPGLKQKNFFKTPYVIIPAAFLAYGVAAQFNGPLKNLDLSVNREIEEGHFHTTADNYLQFVPAAGVLALKLMGVKSENSLRDQAIVLATSTLIMEGTTNILKYSTKKMRPDASAPNSFPSGHTGMAFVGAQMMFHEYHNTSFVLGISGYFVATATGALRVLNNRHWVSDVVAAAGVGIASTELSYLLLPKINHLLFPSGKTKNSLVIAPNINSESVGVAGVWQF